MSPGPKNRLESWVSRFSTICAKNQVLNLKIDKVTVIRIRSYQMAAPDFLLGTIDLVNLRQHPSIWILKTSFRIPKGHFLVYRPCIEKSVVVEATNFDSKSLWIVRVRARLCAAGRSLMHH